MSTIVKFVLFAYLLGSRFVFAESKVTTYITVTQEERKSTQFNITEWMRIRERMKAMDLALAMMSNPEKDRFRLELSLLYAVTDKKDKYGRGQLWLTNIVSQAFGVRTLNIDLGIEGQAALSSSQYRAVDLRIFGKNIQDSSLVLKYGQYSRLMDKKLVEGTVQGAELQLYVFRWLGLEGNYLEYKKPSGADFKGFHWDYGAYIEISLFRIIGGVYGDRRKDLSGEVLETGNFAGVKVQL